MTVACTRIETKNIKMVSGYILEAELKGPASMGWVKEKSNVSSKFFI